MIEARVLTLHDGIIDANYGVWRFLALPRIGETVFVWNAETDLQVSGKVRAIYHSPQADTGPQSTAHITIDIVAR